MPSNNDGETARFDGADAGASPPAPQARAAAGGLLPFRRPLRPGDCDAKELRRKRAEEGLCPKCGEVRTHGKRSGELVPETVQGLVYQGTCLPCSKQLTYGLGWDRVIGASDLKLRWRRSGKGSLKSCFDFAYVRRVEFSGGGDEGGRAGRVSLVAYEEGFANSVVECDDGRMIASFSDMEKAQRMNLDNKIQWFRDACNQLCSADEEPALINVRQEHILEDSIKTVTSFGQADLRKTWTFERERELGELTLQEWYNFVLEQVFHSSEGLWQKCTMDETRVQINFLSELVRPDHLKRFRFVGRVLGKALFDRQLVTYRMPRHLCKLLLGWPIAPDDLRTTDLHHISLRTLDDEGADAAPASGLYFTASEYHGFLKSLEEIGADVVKLGLNFTVAEDLLGSKACVPLVPDGSEIAVNEQNLQDYVESCFKYQMFGRCETQLNELILGFFEVVPEPLLAIFDFQEFESLLFGSYTPGGTEEADDSHGRTGSSREDVPSEQRAAADYWKSYTEVLEQERKKEFDRKWSIARDKFDSMMCGTSPDGKSEEKDVDDGEPQKEEEEQQHSTRTEHRPKTRSVALGNAQPTQSYALARGSSHEEKAEEQPPENCNFPTTNIPSKGEEEELSRIDGGQEQESLPSLLKSRINDDAINQGENDVDNDVLAALCAQYAEDHMEGGVKFVPGGKVLPNAELRIPSMEDDISTMTPDTCFREMVASKSLSRQAGRPTRLAAIGEQTSDDGAKKDEAKEARRNPELASSQHTPGGPAPGQLDALFTDDDDMTARGIRAGRAENPLEARQLEKQRADDAAHARLHRDDAAARSRLYGRNHQAEPTEGGRARDHDAIRSEHVDESLLRSPPRSEPLSPNDAVRPDVLFEPLVATAVVNDESPVYDALQVDNNSVGVDRRISLGQCPTCGLQTHRVSGYIKKKYHPLTDDYVLRGRCLMCNPINSRTRSEEDRIDQERMDAEAAWMEFVEQERLLSEREEAQRLEDERSAAAEARRLEDERSAARAQRSEEGRLAAEAERLEQERLAAEAERFEREWREAAEEFSRMQADRSESERAAAGEEAAARHGGRGVDTEDEITRTPSIEPAGAKDEITRTSSIEPAGANVATIGATEANTKAVTCGHCFANLFMPEDGASFLCERCSKVSCFDGIGIGSDQEKHSGITVTMAADEVNSVKSNAYESHYIAEAEEKGIWYRVNGDIAFTDGKLSTAIELYTRAIIINPLDHQALSNRANAYLRMADTNNAHKDLRSIIDIPVHGPKGYYNKGSAFFLLQRYEDAISLFEKGIVKYPNDQALLYGLKDAKASIISTNDGTHEAPGEEQTSRERGSSSAVRDSDNDGNGQRDQESIDESLDMLGQLVNMAAAGCNLQFVPSATAVLPCDLNLEGAVNPSGLTLDSYFRRDDISAARASLSGGRSETSNDNLTELDATRLLLNSVMECIEEGPIQLPPAYVNMMKTKTVLGTGYFGEVRLGIDEPFGKTFAIKLIKPIVIEQALADRLESIQNSFRNEVKILSQLRHPNIAPLYGYCMGESGLRNTCLVYEHAINGSLDKFWANQTQQHELERERLSEARTRAKIALEVATVLRYMHEGLDGGAQCFHRDIKSANICLTADFSARVIDCGLAKCVTEEPGTFSTAGPTGTPGYTCPEYLGGEISFCSACDVFSFGILLCELITGKISNRKPQHYTTYKRKCKTGKKLEKDADPFVDWGSGSCLKKMKKLALKCIRPESDRRPPIGCVVKELSLIVDNCGTNLGGRDVVNENVAVNRSPSQQSSEDFDGSSQHTLGHDQRKCRLCGEISEKCIQCSGGSQQHVHCHNCLQSALKRNINRFRFGGLACLKDGCDARRYEDEEVASLVSQDVWDSYSNQKNSILFQSMGRNLMNHVESKFEQIQHLLVKLCAGNGLPCPTLFILDEADRNGKPWRNPREWAKNAGSVKLYLKFVCSHSLQPVSDYCRIKVRYSRDWLKAIAPALNASLEIINLSTHLFVGGGLPQDYAKLKEMEEWAKLLLDRSDEEASPNGDIQTLVGNSLSHVAEKAASSNSNWQSELVPVFDYERKEPTFVMKKYASDERYRMGPDIFRAPL